MIRSLLSELAGIAVLTVARPRVEILYMRAALEVYTAAPEVGRRVRAAKKSSKLRKELMQNYQCFATALKSNS